MDKRISDIFDYGDEIVVDWEADDFCDPAEIKELTMKRIHNGQSIPPEMKRAVRKTRPAWRTALVAALIGLLLIGSGLAIYQYTLKDAAIEDVPTDASQRYEWRAGETETQLSLNGFSDSPEYKAYVEWEDWNRAWKAEHPDPWGELGVDDSYTETPDNYWRYEAFFAEQGEALDAIAAKYGLTLLSEHYYIRSETQLCRALGLADFVADGYSVEDGYFFDNGTFKASGDNAVGGKSVMYTVWNNVCGSFIPLHDIIPEEYTEWSYTTKDGVDVILMTDGSRGRTAVIAPLSGSFVTASIQTDDAQAAEAFADAIDLRGLDSLFATDSACAAVERYISNYVENLSSETTVTDIGDDEQAILDYLGDWYITELPEGVTLYDMRVETPDHSADFYHISRYYSGLSGGCMLLYRELDPLDGENYETRQRLSTYTEHYDAYAEINPGWVNTPCTVNGYEAILSEPNGADYGDYELTWVDTDRQLLFSLSMTGTTYDVLMTAAESIDGTAPETPPVRNATTPEERFQFSLMPLDSVDLEFFGGDAAERSAQGKRVLEALGNYGLTEVPEGTGKPTVDGQRVNEYEFYWEGRADWSEVIKQYETDPALGIVQLSLRYKRFDDGRTAEAFEIDKRYEAEIADVADITVAGQSGYISKSGEAYAKRIILAWYDADRDLIFTLTVASGAAQEMTDAELIAMAASVTEEVWTGTELPDMMSFYGTQDPEQVYADLGQYIFSGATYGSAAVIGDLTGENLTMTPFWFMDDGPYVSEFVTVTYADGLALGWQRTWADTARTAENGAESFAAITKYLLACDDVGAVQTGLTVNGHDAICVSYPYYVTFDESTTQLIWYDPDAGLIFSLADFPGEEGVSRTAAQLVTIAESVAAK